MPMLRFQLTLIQTASYCRKYAAEIAHNVSSVKRKAIVDRAAEVNVRLELCNTI